jgi:arylformamidase
MLVRLSYPLSGGTPFYEGLRRPSIDPLYQLERGDACNSYYLTTSNHAGTHVDAPNHFNPGGRRISEYAPDELMFTKPAIVRVQTPDDGLIRPEYLQGLGGVRRDCDILLLHTGFGKYRESDPKTYVALGPGFSRGAASYIMETLPELRAVAMDFMSASSLRHEFEGAEAHRVFLGCDGYSRRSVLLIEDARVPDDLKIPTSVLVVPWLMEGLDSAPCTVLAEL